MSNQNFTRTGRRAFLKAAGIAAASLPAGSTIASVLNAGRVIGANDQIRLGLIGCGSRGIGTMESFEADGRAKFVAVADPDSSRLPQAVGKRKGVQTFVDYRKLLEQKDVDAVVIASTNHWHALHTIEALQAGKDVYVEKPVTFSIDQGPAVLAAAKRYGRIVQAGTQNRSDSGLIPAFEQIRSGKFGAIKKIRGLCYRNRASIGRLEQAAKPPTTVDYNLWLGGAQDLPLMRPQFHYDWHWDFNTGNGDVGNQGPHEFDLIAWLLDDPIVSGQVQSVGNRFAWQDAGNTPNMQTVWYQAAGVPVIFEVNNLWINPQENRSPKYQGATVGIIVTCENAEFVGGRGGGSIYDFDGKKLETFAGDQGSSHSQNFIDGLEQRSNQVLRAPLEKSVRSAAIPHLANLSYRSGRSLSDSELLEQIPAEVAEVIARQRQQLELWQIDAENNRYILGTPVSLNAGGEVRGEGEGSPKVDDLANPKYRPEFAIPREV